MTGLAHYRKTVIGILTFLNVMVQQYTTIAGPNKALWTAIGTAVGAFLVYLTPNTPPA